MAFKSTAVLCYVFSGDKVLLQKKAEGLFGGGKWNAPGGKLHNGERVEEAGLRELVEETGLSASNAYCQGELEFYCGAQATADQLVHVLVCSDTKGSPRGSREGAVEWFSRTALPLEEMWDDDRYWLPYLLAHRKFVGAFYFTEGYERLVKFWVSAHPNLVDQTFRCNGHASIKRKDV
ncbi:MAG: 8-oxo-dGTP diphosphatase [Thermoprotei archaeon]